MAQPSRLLRPRPEHPLHAEAQQPRSDRKDQKALGGCYGNSHKLDQYLAQGAVCVTDVGAGGCDSRSGAGAPRWHPRLPQPRAVPPCRGRAAAALRPARTAHDGAVAGAVGSAGVLPPHPGLCALSGKTKDRGEPGVVCRNAIEKILSPKPPAKPRHTIVEPGCSSTSANSSTEGCGVHDSTARLSFRTLFQGAKQATHHSELLVISSRVKP